MKVMVVGGGGREHALVWKLARSAHVTRLWAAPGNAGISSERLAANSEPVQLLPVGAEDLPALLRFAEEIRPELIVVGPDNPLALGIVDLFQAKGFKIWGPNQRAARFEASKAFSQDFMERHGIPTARAGTFEEVSAARAFAASLGGRCAVKADGLALGKGVLICTELKQAHAAIDEILVRKAFGDAGRKLVIQELLEGREISLHALCDGTVAKLFPTAQDHKRALDGDLGLNTGGMGTVSPAPFFDEVEFQPAAGRILDRWVAGCREEKIDFRGLIYPGLVLTSEGPKVLEFNARFGDPEAQVYLMRLKNDLFELLWASAEGSLSAVELDWSPQAAVCVVMASQGYPGAYAKGKVILGAEEADQFPDTKVFHAGTRWEDQSLVTQGGRVLGVTALGSDLESARAGAYRAVEKIRFDGAQYRRDIGARVPTAPSK